LVIAAEVFKNEPLGDALAGADKDDVKIHTVDTNGRVVLDAKIDVLLDTETEVSTIGEVLLVKLVLTDLEGLLENLGSLGATDGSVDGDLLVSADTEGTDGVTGCTKNEISLCFLPLSVLGFLTQNGTLRFCCLSQLPSTFKIIKLCC
jgi:hypothetical protein